MKKILLPITALAALMMAACGGEASDPVKDLAIKAGNYASQNRIDSLKTIYPTLEVDSVTINFIADSVKVTETDQPGIYTVQLTPDATLTLKKADDNTITVIDSKGLIALTPAQKKIMQAGIAADGATDNTIAKRIADDGFVKFLENKAVQYVAKNFKRGTQQVVRDIQFMMDEGEMRVSVENKMDVDMDAADYTFNIVYYSMRDDSYNTVKENGKDVPAGGTVYYSVPFSGYTGPDRTYVNTTLKNDRILAKYYTPTGKEYDEYLASKK